MAILNVCRGKNKKKFHSYEKAREKWFNERSKYHWVTIRWLKKDKWKERTKISDGEPKIDEKEEKKAFEEIFLGSAKWMCAGKNVGDGRGKKSN